VTQRSAGLPSPQEVTELLAVEFARAGYEVDDVVIDARTRRITVTVDGDTALDLDTVADLSRTASILLDDLDTGDEAYFLEVTSPGVDRPLTVEKHFRRAHGRLVNITLVDGGTVSGRLGALADGGLDVVVRDGRNRSALAVRRIPLAEIVHAVVQVEFSPPSARELELVNGPPVNGPPVNGPPVSGPPVSGSPVSGRTGEKEAGA